eukprot:1188508-Prorocentrum_minimum.AAC.2
MLNVSQCVVVMCPRRPQPRDKPAIELQAIHKLLRRNPFSFRIPTWLSGQYRGLGCEPAHNFVERVNGRNGHHDAQNGVGLAAVTVEEKGLPVDNKTVFARFTIDAAYKQAPLAFKTSGTRAQRAHPVANLQLDNSCEVGMT